MPQLCMLRDLASSRFLAWMPGVAGR